MARSDAPVCLLVGGDALLCLEVGVGVAWTCCLGTVLAVFLVLTRDLGCCRLAVWRVMMVVVVVMMVVVVVMMMVVQAEGWPWKPHPAVYRKVGNVQALPFLQRVIEIFRRPCIPCRVARRPFELENTPTAVTLAWCLHYCLPYFWLDETPAQQ